MRATSWWPRRQWGIKVRIRRRGASIERTYTEPERYWTRSGAEAVAAIRLAVFEGSPSFWGDVDVWAERVGPRVASTPPEFDVGGHPGWGLRGRP